jgi:maleate cis-trans isomerase
MVRRFIISPPSSCIRTKWNPTSKNKGVKKFVEWPVNGIPMKLSRRPVDVILGCVLIPSDYVMKDEAPLLIKRFPSVKIIYHTVQLDSDEIKKSTFVRARNMGELINASKSLAAKAGKIIRSNGGDSSTCSIVGLSCTSFSFSVGVENVQKDFFQGDSKLKNCTDMATAQIDGIKAVNGTKVALLTPYIEEVSLANQETLEKAGLTVVNRLTMGLTTDEQSSQLRPDVISEWARRVNCEEANVVVIGCSALRACQPNFLDELENELGKPVITSTQAFLWKMLRGAGVVKNVFGYGTLFSKC